MASKTFPHLSKEMDKDAWEYVQGRNIALADALEKEVSEGASPESIEIFIRNKYGQNREGIARQLHSAARHLLSLRNGSK